ncbi:AAA family ATPase [Corynebacterium glutamicum]|uniref:AAA family ATPase n=1 Tax=Corynebacterium glutamicum TaxID=1718 RepID=UPI001B8CA12A|nr:AAA family ATPase [Corynebacterium glutamicum]
MVAQNWDGQHVALVGITANIQGRSPQEVIGQRVPKQEEELSTQDVLEEIITEWEEQHELDGVTFDEQLDSWARYTQWSDLLEPEGWSNSGRTDTCGCEIWTRPDFGDGMGTPSTYKSATTHDAGCHRERTDHAHPAMHIWTDHPGEKLLHAIDETGSRTLSMFSVFAALEHDGDMEAARYAAGVTVLRMGGGLPIGLKTVEALAARGYTDLPQQDPAQRPQQEVQKKPKFTQVEQEALSGQPTSVIREYERLKAAEKAKEIARQLKTAEDKDRRGAVPCFDGNELFALPDLSEKWTIEGMWNSDGQALLYAPAKVGKSTLMHNMIESLTSGRPFLGKFDTPVCPGRVGLIDAELSPHKLKEQLSQLESLDRSKLVVWPIRGRLADFDPTDEVNRTEWATRLRDSNIEILVIDCMGPLLKHAGLDEWRDGGMWLQYVRELCAMAGVRAHLVVDHASSKDNGMSNGPRGDSSKVDGPDNMIAFQGHEKNEHANTYNRYSLETYGRGESMKIDLRRIEHGRFISLDEDGGVDATQLAAYKIGAKILAKLEEVHQQLIQEGKDGSDSWPAPTAFWQNNWKQIADGTGVSKNEVDRVIDRMVSIGALYKWQVTASSSRIRPGDQVSKFNRMAGNHYAPNPLFQDNQPN